MRPRIRFKNKHDDLIFCKLKISFLAILIFPYTICQSRRNNMRFNGLQGRFEEDWEVTEKNVPSFIKDEMGMPMHEHVEIEKGHRLKSADKNKCTIILTLTKYMDREAILRRANVISNSETPFSIQADYTRRAKKHRRELGKQMRAAKQAGQDAKIKYDRLVIDNRIDRYDDERQVSVLARENSILTCARGSFFRRSADYRRI